MCWEPLDEWGPLDSDFGDLSPPPIPGLICNILHLFQITRYKKNKGLTEMIFSKELVATKFYQFAQGQRTQFVWCNN
jgi:hypothetical protein